MKTAGAREGTARRQQDAIRPLAGREDGEYASHQSHDNCETGSKNGAQKDILPSFDPGVELRCNCLDPCCNRLDLCRKACLKRRQIALAGMVFATQTDDMSDGFRVPALNPRLLQFAGGP